MPTGKRQQGIVRSIPVDFGCTGGAADMNHSAPGQEKVS